MSLASRPTHPCTGHTAVPPRTPRLPRSPTISVSPPRSPKHQAIGSNRYGRSGPIPIPSPRSVPHRPAAPAPRSDDIRFRCARVPPPVPETPFAGPARYGRLRTCTDRSRPSGSGPLRSPRLRSGDHVPIPSGPPDRFRRWLAWPDCPTTLPSRSPIHLAPPARNAHFDNERKASAANLLYRRPPSPDDLIRDGAGKQAT